MSDVYEWRRFEVGERVRVRRSPECPYSENAPPEIDQFETLITDVDREDMLSDGHVYRVLLPNATPAWVAAAELEPLDAES